MRFRRPGSGQQDLLSQLDHARKLAAEPTGLDKLNAVIDFEIFRPTLIEALGYKDRVDRGGNAPFDPVFMFKVVVLQKYFSLSEEQTEFQIRDRFSFMRFLRLSPGDAVPDKNTVWDFKELLGSETVGLLFRQLDGVLGSRGLHGKECVIVDASFVEVPRQRNTRGENQTIKEGRTPEDWKDQPAKLRQKDTDARWTKKNHQVRYGYKNHIKCDARSKLIRRYRVSPANLHDSQTFGELLEPDDHTVWADSAYRSKESLKLLRSRKLKARVCQKGSRNAPLTTRQKRENRKKSSIRSRVEHIFGVQTYQMKSHRIRTIGILRAAREIGLGNLVYNLLRMVHLTPQTA